MNYLLSEFFPYRSENTKIFSTVIGKFVEHTPRCFYCEGLNHDKNYIKDKTCLFHRSSQGPSVVGLRKKGSLKRPYRVF